MPRIPYINETWFTDTKEDFPGSPIRGKAAFKRAMLRYYFEEDGDRRVAVRLLESPNPIVYIVMPRINRLGNPGLCFVKAGEKDIRGV
jgi:hypothetical protein